MRRVMLVVAVLGCSTALLIGQAAFACDCAKDKEPAGECPQAKAAAAKANPDAKSAAKPTDPSKKVESKKVDDKKADGTK